ncbi:hypothetical protein PR003_g24051 [Phytophthora rubi]|uniref:Uncharacterized protein n=1 Tax=Phytophthora rubi TaxID=129364 RepID=A0A6A4CZZ4_9STRA|nr:hypothetical protein PR002_g23341 [Phytophthora rubi]KAE9295306.1 hypothetical protein PR003_g24051 [Phytophthora rubi]
MASPSSCYIGHALGDAESALATDFYRSSLAKASAGFFGCASPGRGNREREA